MRECGLEARLSCRQRRRRGSGRVRVSWCEHPSRRFLAVRDEVVVGDRNEEREVLMLTMRLRGDAFARGVDDDRTDDGFVGEYRVDLPEGTLLLPLLENRREAADDAAHVAERVGVESWCALVDFAEHHGGHPRPRFCEADECLDELIE